MTYPTARTLEPPLHRYRCNSDAFKTPCSYRGIFWGLHLGEDVDRRAGSPVRSIGAGRVVYQGYHPGTLEKGDWGNIIIIGHRHQKTGKTFYSLYAHLDQIAVKKGDRVELGQRLGVIARGNTPTNGHWVDAHLHFAIYAGPWRGRVLVGFWKRGNTGEKYTRLSWWRDPSQFISSYNIE